ncbi:MAG: protein-export chaperone SecB [Betaproteobacteria bacterium]
MTDTTPAAGNAPVFQLQRVYLKDASLEMPNAPQIFLEAETPAVDVQLEVSNSTVIENVHEVVVRVTATAKTKDKVLFLVEGKQGGIFEMRNIPAEQMGPILGVVCPSIVYPYLRSNIADLITRTGLPPVHLAEVNFEAFYNQKVAALAQQGAGANGNGAASA